MESIQTIAERIKKAKNVLILTHMRPDGDALGGSMALSCALETLGINSEVCTETDLPSNLLFIKGLEKVKKYPQKEYDLLVSLDCSDIQRFGALTDEFIKATRKKIDTINVDHHISNPRFARYNFVEECSANCMHVANLIESMGVTLNKQMAEYLLVGLLTDSGNFAHDDVNEETFALASKLLATGVDIHYYNYQLFKRQTKARAKLHPLVMGGMRYFHDDRFALITITKTMLESCGADIGATEGFVEFPLNVEGVEVSASIMEVNVRQYKISLRSKQYADVNKIAGVFGGGGHVRAAGCMLFGELEEVIDKLSYAVSQYLED